MKKILYFLSIATMLFGSVNMAIANTAENKKEQKKAVSEIYLSVFDTSTEPFTDLKTTELSRHKSNLRLCWIAEGLFTEAVSTIETLKAPAKQMVTSKGSQVSTSQNGKVNVIRTTLATSDQGRRLVRCWHFDETDPLGKYKLQIQIMGRVYQDLLFRLVK
ncbi:hypothetical protein BKK54_06700 [Rodentibacter genomosp. 1]|uniref:Uncharacterized protein n=1 Tax=Rodentibacter genomosp. 1 TaxID=1908264 RepID=A0A1V3J5I2_9PAST|nr:hypothetical protein [Rodentibacter genomosp. 1]OOF50331.1 hypothetical protein BKK54_06700 [Rodentibacter genomosp. 1]